MPDRSPRPRRVPVAATRRRRSRPLNPNPSPYLRGPTPTPLRRSKPRKSVRLLRRYSSEPILWTVRLFSGGDGDGNAGGGSLCDGWSSGIGEALFSPLPRPHTCTDVYSPLLPRSPSRDYLEEAKVVVSVTVEGSPGPVRAMVPLGASIEQAIATVVDRYGREGRSPSLHREAAASFQLHHSHFSLQSLNKSDKIGDVGGRSFYLRKTCGSNSRNIGSEGIEITTGNSEIELISGKPPAVVHTDLFFSFIAKRLNKFGRRTRKLWKVMACIVCV